MAPPAPHTAFVFATLCYIVEYNKITRGFEATMVAYAEPGVGGDAEGSSATEREGGGSGMETARGAPRRSASGLEMSTSIPIIKRLRLYPLVLVVCWSFATINRVHEAFNPSGTTTFALFMLQYAFQVRSFVHSRLFFVFVYCIGNRSNF